MKILVIGGYGRFGGNLARLLSDCEEITFLIAGRNLEKAKQFCRDYEGEAKARPLLCERRNIHAVLQNEKPDIVVDASGPFQIYGDNPYNVPVACIENGIDYLDLADSAAFVSEIKNLDKDAKNAHVSVLSGVSTCPALSGAVVRTLSEDIAVTDISLGIAPSPKADLGLSVIKAILSYAGTALPTVKNGEIAHFVGLTESRNFQIAPQNYPPLKARRFSAVEAPEMRIFPDLYPNLRTVWVGAGTRPEFLLRILNLSALIKYKLGLPSLSPLAPLAHKLMGLFKFGAHRGGMFVEIKGKKHGQEVIRQWHLIAEGDDGPLIPAMAADIFIRKRLAGQAWLEGAYSAENALTLADFDAHFSSFNIFASHRTIEQRGQK